MHRLSKLKPFALVISIIASTIVSCSGFLPKPVSTTTPVSKSTDTIPPTTTPVSTSIKTLTPITTPVSTSTETLAPSYTPTLTVTPSPRPTKTSTPQPQWVTDFAQPILDVIALRTPDFQDDFDDKSGGWQADRCGQRMKYVDGELVLTDCSVHRAHMDYADFVAELDARFLPDTNHRSRWQFIFRLYDAPYTHFAVNFYGSVYIIDLLNREQLEFPSVANPGLATNHLLVIAKGTKFAFYVNNKPFYYLESPSVFRQGDIFLGYDDGSGAIDLAHPAIVAFDNFKIWNIWDISIP